MRRLAIVLIVAFLMPTRAFAWGSEGHRIIAEIAEQHLEPDTAKRVRDLLAIENNTSLADIANWADQIRRQRRDTAPWHFVDIPVDASTYDPARDCRRRSCIVAQLDRFIAVLRRSSAPSRERLEALKFVVHFVGDLHQPLHAADNDDRGGNDVHVIFSGHRTNLHAVWDSGLLAPVVNGDERAYALRLAHAITPNQIRQWQNGSTVAWVNESHGIAVEEIYGKLAHDAGRLPASYERQALSMVNEQLERAGVRLAYVLNVAFGAER
jgi:hypothetical protein